MDAGGLNLDRNPKPSWSFPVSGGAGFLAGFLDRRRLFPARPVVTGVIDGCMASSISMSYFIPSI
jgi:hypothetical protein